MASSTHVGIVVVGAGMGGLGFGMALKRQWGYENFVLLEKASDIGGTWRDNVYPGCASDVPIHWYSYSTDMKPDWNRSHGLQPEIQDYLHTIANKYGLRPHCRFGVSVVSAVWDREESVWRIITEDVETRAQSKFSAKVLISATGLLCEPNLSVIEGAAQFKGSVFHSARWRYDVDLKGKRVGVIGNGCSATQFVPIISDDPSTQVVNFCRTAMWYVDGTFTPYSTFSKWVFTRLPFFMKIHRNMIAATFDARYIVFPRRFGFINRYMQRSMTKYIQERAPAKYHDKIIPKYPPGCRRIIRDTGYLECLHRPNVNQNWDGIERVTKNGIVTKNGEEIPLDVIVYATGFITDKHSFHVEGTEGTLDEYFDAQGGPTAYLGTTVPGFPNFIMMQGPNTTTGHASVIFTEETQIDYALKLMEPIMSGVLSTFQPTHAATDAYNTLIQGRLTNTVWMSCTSWYRAGHAGKVFSTFPGPLVLYWWWLRAPRWDDYRVEGKGKPGWERKRALESVASWVGWAGVVAVLAIAIVTGTGGMQGNRWLEFAKSWGESAVAYTQGYLNQLRSRVSL